MSERNAILILIFSFYSPLLEDMNMSNRLRRIALGQGQGKKAVSLIEKGTVAGDW